MQVRERLQVLLARRKADTVCCWCRLFHYKAVSTAGHLPLQLSQNHTLAPDVGGKHFLADARAESIIPRESPLKAARSRWGTVAVQQERASNDKKDQDGPDRHEPMVSMFRVEKDLREGKRDLGAQHRATKSHDKREQDPSKGSTARVASNAVTSSNSSVSDTKEPLLPISRKIRDPGFDLPTRGKRNNSPRGQSDNGSTPNDAIQEVAGSPMIKKAPRFSPCVPSKKRRGGPTIAGRIGSEDRKPIVKTRPLITKVRPLRISKKETSPVSRVLYHYRSYVYDKPWITKVSPLCISKIKSGPVSRMLYYTYHPRSTHALLLRETKRLVNVWSGMQKAAQGKRAMHHYVSRPLTDRAGQTEQHTVNADDLTTNSSSGKSAAQDPESKSWTRAIKVPALAPLRSTSRTEIISNARMPSRGRSCRSSPSLMARFFTVSITSKSPETRPAPINELPLPSISDVGIRKHLQLWQERQESERDQMASPLGLHASKQEPRATIIATSVEDDNVGALISADSNSHQEEGETLDYRITEEGDTSHSQSLSCGDVVQFRTNTEPMLAVFIRSFQKQAQYYNMQGEWFHRSMSVTNFTTHGMFSREDIAPILPYLPNREVAAEEMDKFKTVEKMIPREITRSILDKLQVFHRATGELYRNNMERLDRAHALLAMPYRIRMMTLPEIALELLQKRRTSQLSDIMLWTVNAALGNNHGFSPVAKNQHRVLPMWRVAPLKQMQDYEQVRAWIREYLEGVVAQVTIDDGAFEDGSKDALAGSNPLPAFIQKARRLIRASRSHRKASPPCLIGPSSRQVRFEGTQGNAVVRISSLTAWKSTERAVIDFLDSWANTGDIPDLGSTFSLGPMLLRALDMYQGFELDAQTASLFLREIAVQVPWESRAVFNSMVRLPSPRDPTVQVLQERAFDSRHEDELDDSMADLRKDWGDMVVYCIDKASSREIDDGFSLERIEGDESTFWVHIHIANPSAFVQPNSAIARYAATQLETLYLFDKVFPMIRPDLSQKCFGLARDRPVLSISVRLTRDGDLLETKITPGRVHNVKRLTANQVEEELGFGRQNVGKSSRMLRVGHLPEQDSPASTPDTLSSLDISDLAKLEELGKARYRRRNKSMHLLGEPFHGSHDLAKSPYVYVQQGGLGPTFSTSFGRYIIGDPAISWEIYDAELTQSDQDFGLVSDIMIIAGEAVAQWCSVRKIPGIYVGTVQDKSCAMTPEEYKAAYIDTAPANDPMLFEHRWVYNRLLGQSVLRSTPLPHGLLGAQAYVKATSPLRRYQDMIMHWQIQAAFRYEAEHGKDSLIDSTDESYLPFSRAMLDAELPRLEVATRDIRRVTGKAKRHWIAQLLARAFHFGEAELPAMIDVFVVQESTSVRPGAPGAVGRMKQLSGLNAQLLLNDVVKKAGGFRAGDWWETRMHEVNTYNTQILVMPMRLLSRQAERPSR